MGSQSHTLLGLVVWSIPVAFLMTRMVRWRAADGVFANVPDLGPLRLHSYRVLGHKKPTTAVTLVSATVGAGSHILIDAFTHAGRWGANALGLNGFVGSVPLRGEMTGARVLQYLGHVGGTAAFVVVLLAIASSGHLECWYGTGAVAKAREAPPARGGPALFWAIVVACIATAVVVSQSMRNDVIFLPVLVAAVSVVVTGTAVGRSARVSDPVRVDSG